MNLLAFPYLFPTAKLGYDIQLDIKLSPVKCFNQCLLNYTQLFVSEANYIFLGEVLSMVKQLGLPTFFVTGCTDLRWDGLKFIIATSHGEKFQ